jgi:hypothetical protein
MDPVACAGVPRELGEAMGRAARAELRAACSGRGTLARALDRLGRMEAGDARWWRDLRRHFPHQAEWLEGEARGAGLALPALVRAARAALDAPAHALVAIAREGEAGLVCPAPARATLRRVAPEGRFRSLELALPQLPTPWLGVNEAGLAVAAMPGSRTDGACAAPAALFARDCLERFESVGSALAWCLGRPAAPGASLLLADASGEVAGVELAPRERRVRRAERGLLVLGADPARVAVIEKQLADGGPETDALATALGVMRDLVDRADARGRRLSRGGAWQHL